jgi:hypothetical protein
MVDAEANVPGQVTLKVFQNPDSTQKVATPVTSSEATIRRWNGAWHDEALGT